MSSRCLPDVVPVLGQTELRHRAEPLHQAGRKQDVRGHRRGGGGGDGESPEDHGE